MALTPERIDEIAGPADYFDRRVFARAIEAEVRKADTELIRQMLDALESVNQAMPFPVASTAIASARARLKDQK